MINTAKGITKGLIHVLFNERKAAALSNWILATGLWNDSKVWDDSKFWID